MMSIFDTINLNFNIDIVQLLILIFGLFKLFSVKTKTIPPIYNEIHIDTESQNKISLDKSNVSEYKNLGLLEGMIMGSMLHRISSVFGENIK